MKYGEYDDNRLPESRNASRSHGYSVRHALFRRLGLTQHLYFRSLRKG